MTKKTDKIIGLLFLFLTLAFIIFAFYNQTFFDWVFQRHQNQLSWYIRPLFLIPYCYFAYKKSYSGIFISLFCLFTSMFWFPTPETVSEQVEEFLKFEKEYLLYNWNIQKIMLSLLIPISLGTLALAFWKKSFLLGLAIMFFMATAKVLWSVINAGDSGFSILIPAVVGLAICSFFLLYSYKKLKEKNSPKEK